MKNYMSLSPRPLLAALPDGSRWAAIFSVSVIALPGALAQQVETQPLNEVVISASRKEQLRFDAAAAIDSVQVDPFRTASPLVNLSELLSAVPGLQIRERQNFAQE